MGFLRELTFAPYGPSQPGRPPGRIPSNESRVKDHAFSAVAPKSLPSSRGECQNACPTRAASWHGPTGAGRPGLQTGPLVVPRGAFGSPRFKVCLCWPFPSARKQRRPFSTAAFAEAWCGVPVSAAERCGAAFGTLLAGSLSQPFGKARSGYETVFHSRL